ncbi:DUF2637 domain-containing protein [Sphaerisporangium sp. NPDC005289]|uniref:DUF2637 domain-containing protein n=1 Tax=Sphaerisporangium sp. NPDC005289 TaxID=3155247 RepID=UPI00339F6558
MLRRIATAVAGLALVALAGVACVLSFDAIRAIALSGGARADLAYLYPAGFDALLVIALIAVLLLGSARLLMRLQAWLILAVLIVAAGAANVLAATHTTVEGRQLAVGVAVAPWVMLLVGLWLFLLPAGHLQARAADDEPSEGPTGQGAGHDILPFGREERDPGLAPPLETAVHTTGHDREIVPHLASPDDLEPDVVPVVPPTPAPETPTVDELPPLRSDDGFRAPRREPTPQPAPSRADAPGTATTDPAGSGDTAYEAEEADGAQADGPNAGAAAAGAHTPPQAAPATPAAAPEARAAARPASGVTQPVQDAGEPVLSAGQPVQSAGRPVHGAGEPVRGAGEPASQGAGRRVPEAAPPLSEAAPPLPEAAHEAPAPEPEQRLVPKPRERAAGPRAERDPGRPLRWGDLVRPSAGDVLVHPLPKPTRELGDTQPYPNVTHPASAQSSPDTAADMEPEEESADTQPYPHLREEASPLSDRAPHDVAPQEQASPQDAPPHDLPSHDTPPQDVAAQDVAAQDVAAQDVAAQDVAAQDVAAQDVAGWDVAAQDVAAQDVAGWESGEAWEADAAPDPAHDGADSADEDEALQSGRPPYTPQTAAPPSGRMRSTPLPPEE